MNNEMGVSNTGTGPAVEGGKAEGSAAKGAHAAPVVNIKNQKYTLDEAELDRVLMRADIQDLPVAVVSVAGVFRAGKSFLLNFFLRYLESPECARADGSWLSSEGQLEGFSWRSGGEPNTSGILLWSEPIVTVLPDGRKVAILLMDTQGTFDSTSTFRDCSTIFAISILLSSVQIYNLSSNINESDLQHLQFFTQFGNSSVNIGVSKPFQTLEFLVRDWPFPYEHPYGEEGGRQLLENRLKIKADQPKELRELREQIRALFEKVSCFLMPHPGFAVMEPDFKGAINEIRPMFITQLKNLVASLFSPEKLLIKKINGEVVNARQFAIYFKAYMKIFNSDKVPAAGSVLEVTIREGFLMASDEGRHVYESGMEKECGLDQPSVPVLRVKELHAKYLASARATFSNKKTMGSKEEADRYLQKLMQDLEPRLSDYEAINLSKLLKTVEKAKKAYKRSIGAVHGAQRLCVHAVDLDGIHNEAVVAAVAVFDADRPRVDGRKDDERTAFIQSFESEYQQLRLENEQNNKNAVMEIRLAYEDFMRGKCVVQPPLTSAEFKQQHEIGLSKALEDFKNKRNKPDSYTEDVYKSNLVRAISASFTQLKAFNKRENKIQINAALNAYDEYMRLTWHIGQCLHPEDLMLEHKAAKCKALLAYKPDKFCLEGLNLSDEDEALIFQMIQTRFEELRGINETANEAAIQAAFEAFKALLEDRIQFSWWWLLIIPLLHTAASVPKYIKEAKQAAYNVFISKRRPGGLYSNDPYMDRLNTIMNEALQLKST